MRNGIVVFICKDFFAELTLKELGISRNQQTKSKIRSAYSEGINLVSVGNYILKIQNTLKFYENFIQMLVFTLVLKICVLFM